jgi:hypothetical protein
MGLSSLSVVANALRLRRFRSSHTSAGAAAPAGEPISSPATARSAG